MTRVEVPSARVEAERALARLAAARFDAAEARDVLDRLGFTQDAARAAAVVARLDVAKTALCTRLLGQSPGNVGGIYPVHR